MQVFQEPSSPEPEPDFRQGRSAITKHKDSLDTRFSSPLHRNEVTRTNPLFDPNQYDDDDPGDSNINPSAVCEDGTKKLKHDTKHLYHTEATLHKQDSSELLLMKPDSSRDQSKETSTRKGGELSNFTITTYQRPHDPDGLFDRDGDNNAAQPVQHLSTDTRKKPTTVFQHKYRSTDSLNSSGAVGSGTSVSRTNSFNSNDSSMFKIPGPVSTSSVKRSTSYISLVAKPPSFPGNGFQSGRTYAPYSNRTKSVGNLAVEAQLDADDETAYENWGLGKMRKCSVSHDPSESVQKGIESQTTAEKQKMARGTEVGHEEQRGSQQQIIITEEERARLLALQEQFLQLQEQLLQNSGHMQQISQTHAPAADTPLQSLQVRNSSTCELILRNTHGLLKRMLLTTPVNVRNNRQIFTKPNENFMPNYSIPTFINLLSAIAAKFNLQYYVIKCPVFPFKAIHNCLIEFVIQNMRLHYVCLLENGGSTKINSP